MNIHPRMLVLPLLAAVALAQDPPTPPGGFPITVQTVAITFSDGVQTGMDIYVPNAVAGATGWPGVLVVHAGDGGTKNDPAVVAASRYLARFGYVAYAYTGPARSTQERDLLDSAESHGLAQTAVVGTTIDPARLAVTGFSGGGRKSYAAAAYSGRPLPLAGFVTDYPPVLAISPQIAPLDSTEISVPGGVMAGDHIVAGKPATHPWIQAIAAGDYAGLRALVDSTYNQDLLANLGTSTVPVLAMVAMQDFKIINNPSIDAFLNLPQGPKRLFLSTGSGHSTIDNDMETAVMQDLRRRWFDHFLKGIPNGVELEPLVELGVQPTSTALHLNPTTIWEHRTATTWPSPLPNARYHLVGTQGLSTTPPVALDLTNVITHTVPAAYDIAAYVGAGAGLNPGNVTANIAPSNQVFVSPPLTEDIEILGRARVGLTVDDTTGLFQLTAVLAHQTPAGVLNWITAGTSGNRSGVAGAATMSIELGDVAQVVPAGDRLVLKITNLCDINGPGSRRIRTAPYFESTVTTLRVGPGLDNYLDLPSRPYQATLLPRLAHVSTAAGFALPLELRGGSARAGQTYVVALGVTGEAPGFVLNGVQVPLNIDAITNAGLSLLNTPLLPNSLGMLNGNGTANPGFALPPFLASPLTGVRFTFVAGVLDAGGNLEVVGGPATVILDP